MSVAYVLTRRALRKHGGLQTHYGRNASVQRTRTAKSGKPLKAKREGNSLASNYTNRDTYDKDISPGHESSKGNEGMSNEESPPTSSENNNNASYPSFQLPLLHDAVAGKDKKFKARLCYTKSPAQSCNVANYHSASQPTERSADESVDSTETAKRKVVRSLSKMIPSKLNMQRARCVTSERKAAKVRHISVIIVMYDYVRVVS